MPQILITEMKSEHWVGLYVAGGGVTGVMRALREDGGPASKRLVVVAHELTNETHAGPAEGIVKVVRSHLPAHTHTGCLRTPCHGHGGGAGHAPNANRLTAYAAVRDLYRSQYLTAK